MLNSLLFKVVGGLLITAGVGGYILILQANLNASKAEMALNVAALSTAQSDNRSLVATLATERKAAAERDAANKRATATYKANIAAAEAQQTVLTRTITVEREKDATLDACLGMRLPDDILRQLAQ